MAVCVVTGASGGIGRFIALGLVEAGHELVMIGRSAQNLKAAREWISSRSAGAVIAIETADLSLLSDTRRVGKSIVDTGKKVGVLVNNAGIFAHRRSETAEGHEQVLAVNHLAPFVLTQTLLPALGQGARIVNVGSSTSDKASIDPNDLEGRRRWGLVHTYAQSKLALLMTTTTWAERLRAAGIIANTVHPGAVATNLVRAPGAIGFVWRRLAPFLLTEAQGAIVPLRAATSPDLAGVTGRYLKKQGPVTPNRLALDAALRRRVWDATELLIGHA